MSANPQISQPDCHLYDHEITWLPFAGIENLELSLLDIDEERSVVDLIVRFAPNKTVTMHNHLAQTNMLIIQGELRIYEPDGSIREARTPGRYYRGRTGDAHSEGGGPDGAGQYSVTRDGLLLYAPGKGSEDMPRSPVWLTPQGTTETITSRPAAPSPPGTCKKA